ncbi:ArsR family transcriptional regulator [Bacillus sp. JJ1764]|uniref:ArsR family transcriptional regulator n=1 Tax=Bacillus sp. JJ1764 TaxID=3122964 RepID=UPI002FFEF7C4
MTIRLGIFGSKESVAKINSIVEKNPSFKSISIIWDLREGNNNPLHPYCEEVDAWLFAGDLALTYAKKWGEIKQPTYSVEYTGSSLYKTLLLAAYAEGLKIEELSFDSFELTDLKNSLKEINISEKPLYLKPFDESLTLEDYVDFHYSNWKEQKIKGVITCIPHIKSELESLGIPVFRILPTKSAIETKLNSIVLAFELQRYQTAQIAVQVLELDTENKLSKDLFSTDELLNLELKITDKLLKYARRLQGSLKAAGLGKFVIFSTRGVMEKITDSFCSIPEMAELDELGLKSVTCGIGVGYSAYEAEINAVNALIHAKEFGKGTWMALLDHHEFIGPLGAPNQLNFSYHSAELESVSKKTSLSISTLSKIASILNKMKTDEVDVKELSQFLQIMPRSAQRIITALEAHGYATVIRQESPHVRGRPKKIYQIHLND